MRAPCLTWLTSTTEHENAANRANFVGLWKANPQVCVGLSVSPSASVCLSIYLSIRQRLSVCLSVRPSASVSLQVYQSVWQSFRLITECAYHLLTASEACQIHEIHFSIALKCYFEPSFCKRILILNICNTKLVPPCPRVQSPSIMITTLSEMYTAHARFQVLHNSPREHRHKQLFHASLNNIRILTRVIKFFFFYNTQGTEQHNTFF